MVDQQQQPQSHPYSVADADENTPISKEEIRGSRIHRKTILSSPRLFLRKSWCTTWQVGSRIILILQWIPLIYLITTQMFCLLLRTKTLSFPNFMHCCVFIFCLSIFVYVLVCLLAFFVMNKTLLFPYFFCLCLFDRRQRGRNTFREKRN